VKKIAIVMLIVAAIAFVGVGQEQTDYLEVYPEMKEWVILCERLGGVEQNDCYNDACGYRFIDILNAIVDRIEARKDPVIPENTFVYTSEALELETRADFGPPYIIRINNPDTVEELWIGDELVDVMAWRPSLVFVFTVGVVLGALFVFLVGGE